MLPAPIVLPSDHCPVVASIVVRLFAEPPLPGGTPASDCVRAALGICTAAGPSLATAVVAADILELLREWLGLDEVRRESRVDSVRFGGGPN